MADSTDMALPDNPEPARSGRLGRRVRLAALVAGGAVLAAGGGLWLARERIADGLIARELASLGLPATYRIVSIGPRSEVLGNIVVGDPRHPDLVIEQAQVDLGWGWSGAGFGPRIGQVRLVRPRLYGQMRDGRLSLGALDRLLYGGTPSKEPFRLPDWRLSLVDARGLVDSPQGRLAFKAEGEGALRGGFAGTLALVAPRLALGACQTGRATAYGRVTIADEQPRFEGPVRVAQLACPGSDLRVGGADFQLDALGDRDLAGVTLKGHLRTSALAAAGAGAQSLGLDTALAWRSGVLSGRVSATAGGLRSGQGGIGLLGLDGLVKVRQMPGGGADSEFRGTVDARGLRRGAAFDTALASAEKAVGGTLAAPMVAQIRRRLGEEERGSRFAADLTVRHGHDGAWSVVVPQGALRGGSGQALLALGKVQVSGKTGQGRDSTPHFVGNFITGGQGLPHVTGMMERDGRNGGGAQFHLAMADYAVAGQRLAVPELVVVQAADGTLGFSGTSRMSGAIPGGRVANLVLPVSGTYGAHGALALWHGCITPRFDSLALGEMTLDARAVRLCPVSGQPMVRAGTQPFAVAMGTPGVALSGRMGGTPMRLETGAVGLAWPGTLTARGVNLALGAQGSAMRLVLADLTAHLGRNVAAGPGTGLAGTFEGVEARMGAVPMDLTGAGGTWRFAGGRLDLADTRFDLTDRANPARFEKLHAQGATLALADGRISADALLRNPASGRAIVRAQVVHDLSHAQGHADLKVDGLTFDKDFQPAQLTSLAKGVIANAQGTVTGSGRIDWRGDHVTSSGKFGSQGIDFAAAFGPVKGLSGSLVFTDLLAMETAPHQKLKVASINPGVEVTDGTVDLRLRPDTVVEVNDARWPFMGGTLHLEPTVLRFAKVENRNFTLVIDGLDAAQFISRMEMANLTATGVFDGRLPVIFDATGGHIVGGTLTSRGGGNVSYVGALTYKDLSAMANYAFRALRSLDYRSMTIAMRGDIAGDFVTQVQFAGVSQGKGASRNFLTRQVANLPIQFNLNVRAPFYSLLGTYKSMYDPSVVKDPRTIGLLDARGRSRVPQPGTHPVRAAASVAPVAPAIQPSASGSVR